MGRTYNFSSNGRLAAINGASTGAAEANIVIAENGASQLTENPNFDPSPDSPAAAPALPRGPNL